MGMCKRLNGRLTDRNGWVLRWWHSWMFLATVSSWTTLSELLFYSWNVPKQKQHQVTASARELSCCKDLNIKTSDPFLQLSLKGTSNKRIGLSNLWEKEKDSKRMHIRFCMWTPVQRTNTHKGIHKQQMLYFGQCQILKREQKKQVKMQGVILKTCQEAEPIKQNSAGVLSQYLILCYNISTVNLPSRGTGDQSPFCLHTDTHTEICFPP